MNEAIESVFAQTYDDWEVLLADDGSTDGSTAIAQRYAHGYPEKVHYLEHAGHENRGMSASRNLGFRHASGGYIALLDADDVWLPNKLEEQVGILTAYPEAGMLYGATQYWYSWTGNLEDRKKDYIPDLGVPAETLHAPPSLSHLLYPLGKATSPCMSDLLIRSETIDRVGGFEESFKDLYEDQAFLAKVYLKESVVVVKECWDRYRIHPESCMARVTRDRNYHLVRRHFLEWLAGYLARQNNKDEQVAMALQKALWPYRHPMFYRVKKRAQYFRSRMF